MDRQRGKDDAVSGKTARRTPGKRHVLSPDDPSGEILRLRRELADAQDRQAAMAEVLRAVNASAGALAPIFDIILRKAVALCGAQYGILFRTSQDGFLASALHNVPDAYARRLLDGPHSFGMGTVTGRAAITRRPVQISDLDAEDSADDQEIRRATVELGGARTIFSVPILKGTELLGAITIYRKNVDPFREQEINLVQAFADQSALAIENARILRELQERNEEATNALEQQSATAGILRVISTSPTDTQPVFDTIAENAARLCNATFCHFFRFDGELLHFVSHFRREQGPVAAAAALFPSAPVKGHVAGRSILSGKVEQIEDYLQDPDYTAQATIGGDYRSLIGVPVMRADKPIGTIVVARRETGKFPHSQVELLKTFADQAAIAIDNVRLFTDLRARNEEQRELIQQQTATAEVLKVISRSAFDLKPVLNALVRSAVDLCEAYDAVIFLRDGVAMHVGAHHGPIPVDFPTWPVSRAWVTGRAVVDCKPVHVENLLAAKDEFPDGQDMARRMGHRTILAMPLLRGEEAIGALTIRRKEIKPFSPKQIELLATFADQAVIAIENVRLLDELKARNKDISDALEQQTATSEILKVISTSPTDTQPVFDAIAESAARLCSAKFCFVFRYDGTLMHFVAHHGIEGEALDIVTKAFPVVPGRQTTAARSLISGQVEQVPEIDADAEYGMRELAHSVRYRSVVAVPMKLHGKPIGTIAVVRAEPGFFPDRQVELLQTFAGQAVIAIENVRLFGELQARTEDLEEALDFQKGTAEVLEVIGRSASSLQPVLDAILETTATLCHADMAVMRLVKDGALHFAAGSSRNDPALTSYSKRNPIQLGDQSSIAGRVASSGATVHVHDVAADPDYHYLAGVPQTNVRTALGVPLIQAGEVVGVLALLKSSVEPFTARQIKLVETFADQTVIALSNVQLFEKLESRTVELARSLEDLRNAQDRLIQTEKLASLGQLTAGIAHEIKNPLNFINNFSAVSGDLIKELADVVDKERLQTPARAEIDELVSLIMSNLDKVVHHGKRADSIVRNMLLHSREGSGDHRMVDINNVVEESLNLAYHGARAEKPGFNVTLVRDFDPAAGQVDIYPQEMTRVLLNLLSNGFHATGKRRLEAGNGYEPTVAASTRDLGDRVEVRIRDNGTGIPDEVRHKIFNPFFTTKPAGEGTGLGLSLSHDIIVKQHSGRIEVDTEPGAFTEFRIILPRNAASRAGPGGGP